MKNNVMVLGALFFYGVIAHVQMHAMHNNHAPAQGNQLLAIVAEQAPSEKEATIARLLEMGRQERIKRATIPLPYKYQNCEARMREICRYSTGLVGAFWLVKAACMYFM